MPIPMVTRACSGLLCDTPQESGWFSTLVHRFLKKRADAHWRTIGTFVYGKVLDVGMGSGVLSNLLRHQGFEIEGVDVADLSIYEDFSPTLYDGETLPYRDNEFDTALLICVLHHCEDNLTVLQEAKRVAKRVVVVEDTYRSKIEKSAVSLQDQLCNFEFYEHTYLQPEEWKRVIERNRWKIVDWQEWSQFSWGMTYSRYCQFVIE